MAIPDNEMRTFIGFALARIQVRQGNTEILNQLDRAFPGADEARLLQAIHLARQYARTAARTRETLDLARRRGVPVPRQTIASFFPPEMEVAPQISARIYFKGNLQNGQEVRGSVVFTFDSGATLGTVISRAGALICGGHLPARYLNYQCERLTVEIQSISPYSRGTGIPLDTAPITREHPNPYPRR